MLHRRDGPDLRVVILDFVEDCLVRGFAEATLLSGLDVMFESGAQPLWTVVKSISKWLMNTFYGVPASHEDLKRGQFELLALAFLAENISLFQRPLSMHADVSRRR